ncbi:MAG: rhodanese-related sulfurtransferase, partial [Hyphomicrobiales bacterium]
MPGPDDVSIRNLTQSPVPYKVLAFYKFADLDDCETLRPELAQFCCGRKIRGTFILAPEGINGTVAGTPDAIDALLDYLYGGAFGTRLAGAEAKVSWSETMPFLRMKVRIKPEIVTLRAPEANPARQVGTYVEPEDWNALIGAGDVTLIDTRNDYEAAIGTFEGAIDPQTKNFTEFKDYVATHLDPAKQKKVAMFCTGGIRCEKASSYLLAQGFEEVFHLKGGILKYLEVTPEAESRFNGECFVFDERVAVTHGLAQGEARLCRACRNPMPSTRACGAIG